VYERVLVPTDGSEPASAAVRHALGIAETCGATLHAVFVIDTSTGWLTVSKSEVHDALREVGQDASEEVLRDVETAAADTDVALVTEALEGTPDERIVEYTVENDIDLVVMGTHGRGGIEHRLLGSVSERVIWGTDVPVMTVSPSPED